MGMLTFSNHIGTVTKASDKPKDTHHIALANGSLLDADILLYPRRIKRLHRFVSVAMSLIYLMR